MNSIWWCAFLLFAVVYTVYACPAGVKCGGHGDKVEDPGKELSRQKRDEVSTTEDASKAEGSSAPKTPKPADGPDPVKLNDDKPEPGTIGGAPANQPAAIFLAILTLGMILL